MKMEPYMKWQLCKEGKYTYYIIPPEMIRAKCGLGFQFKLFGEEWKKYLRTKEVIFNSSETNYTIKGEEKAKEILSKLNSMWKKKLVERMAK